jgi:hypothetical protein
LLIATDQIAQQELRPLNDRAEGSFTVPVWPVPSTNGQSGCRGLRNSDLRIRLASEWLNGMAIPFRATLFEKSRTTN